MSTVCVYHVNCLFNYTGYKVYMITPQDASQLEMVQNLEHEDMLDTWAVSHAVNTSTYVMTHCKYDLTLRLIMSLAGLEENTHYKVFINDVQENLLKLYSPTTGTTLGYKGNDISININTGKDDVTKRSENVNISGQITDQRIIAFDWAELIKSLLRATTITDKFSKKEVKTLEDMYNKLNDKGYRSKRATDDDIKSKSNTSASTIDPSTLFSKFFSYEQVIHFLDAVAHKYPSNTKVETIAKTFEGRKVKSIKIYSSEKSFRENPIVMIVAGMNGREWSGVVMTLFGILRLLKTAEAEVMLKKMSFVIVPLANPDGYVYSWEHARYWKKSRTPQIDFEDCVGVHLTQNFPPVDPSLQTSCHSMYVGKNTEEEVKAIIHLAETVGHLFTFITINGYGSKILYPKSSTKKRSQHYDLMQQIAIIFVDNVGDFVYGQYSEMQRPRNGSAIDYFDQKEDLHLAFEIQMRVGAYDLDPIGLELYKSIMDVWIGIEMMCKAIYDILGP